MPSFTQQHGVSRKTGKNLHDFGLKSGQNLVMEQSQPKIKTRFGLSVPKNPYNIFLFDHY